MRLVPLNAIKEGSYLGKTLYDGDGRVLLRQGVELNHDLIAGIRDSGIYTLYINDEYSQNEIDDIIKPELRLKAISTIKKAFETISKLDKCANVKKNNIRDDSISSIKEVSECIVEELSTNNNLLINLVDIKSMDSYTYQHSVNVALLSLVLGIELGLNRVELGNLCLGALLHDIGKVFIHKELLEKDKLTDSELEEYKSHTSLGFNYLKESPDINPTARIIALQHHARVDSTEFPSQIDANTLTKLSKIVSIADNYDSLTSDRPGHKALPPNEVIEYIMGAAGRHFDFDMVQVFCRKIFPFPEGTLVKLSNDETAIVDDMNINYPLRPKVKILRQTPTTVKMEPLDLMEHSNLTIKGIAY